MKTPLKIGITSLAVVGIVGAGWFVTANRKPTPIVLKAPEVNKAFAEAQKSPKSFVAKNADSTDKNIQTAVTRARMTTAYESAKNKNFSAARVEFIEASFKHKGTEAMDPGFGSLSDQAAYQAIVCLDADGKKDEAIKEFRKFMADRPLSPLIHACFRRLERLNKQALPEDQLRLENGIAAQEKKINFETSVCGPKCLEKILPMLEKEGMNYQEIAKISGTTDKGTTLEGLKKASQSLGLPAIGLELNNRDFLAMKKPFIWLQADHYIAVLEIKNGRAHFYDPRFNLDEWKTLPKEDDPKFRAQVLAFEVPSSDLNAEIGKTKTTEKPLPGGVPTK